MKIIRSLLVWALRPAVLEILRKTAPRKVTPETIRRQRAEVYGLQVYVPASPVSDDFWSTAIPASARAWGRDE